MNFIFDILILKSEFHQLKLSESFVQWGDELISYDPPEYKNKTGLEFYSVSNYRYYEKVAIKYGIEDHIAVRLKYQYLEEFETLVNSQNVDIEETILVKFLKHVYNSVGKFAVFLFRNEDFIDERCKVSTEDEFIAIFTKSMMGESQKGVVLYR